jgi:hypothetical protein
MSTTSVSPLRQRMIEDMSLRDLAPGTQQAYIRGCRKLAKRAQRFFCGPGRHIVYVPAGSARVEINERDYSLAEDHGLRVRLDAGTDVAVQAGKVIVGSIHAKP